MVLNFFIIVYYLFSVSQTPEPNSADDQFKNYEVTKEQNTSPLNHNFDHSSFSDEQIILNNTRNSDSGNIIPDALMIESGLIFEKALVYRLDNSSYNDRIQLLDLNATAQAFQFRIQVNKSENDSTILIVNNITKGSNLNSPNWVLDYNIIKGPIYPNGASEDEIYILIYNITPGGSLIPGDYLDLLKVNYDVVAIDETEDSVKSSLIISHAQASTIQGDPIDIAPSRDELMIVVPGIIPEYGLIFQQDTVYREEDDIYTDVMRLVDLEFKAQALQFRLQMNKAIDDNVVLAFQSIDKGEDIRHPSWVMTYNIFRGPITGNGASVDEVLVLLWNLSQNNGLLPGTYNELLKVNYGVAELPSSQDTIKSSIRIANAEASTFEGFPVDITPSRNELTVIVTNEIGIYGDVNNDGCLDILDVVMVVDHIVGRDSLNANEFLRADIAPWTPGHLAPDPDGIVNVQDLTLLQNIILLGEYPNGNVINSCPINNSPIPGETQTKQVTFYINENGITVYSNSDIDLRGAQIELGNILDDPENMVISTDLGNGYYLKVDELLRVLLYDRQGIKIVNSGERILADLPFRINNPELITIEKLILIDVNRHRILSDEIEIELVHGYPPSLNMDYVLFQNYPNPFNPQTTVQYSIPVKSNVTLRLFDLLGNEIATLVKEEKFRGTHSVNFDGRGMASGVYFYQMIAVDPLSESGPAFVQTKKMVLIK